MPKLKATLELSADTALLYARLKRLAPSETASYEDLSEVIGRDVRNGARSNLGSAMRRALTNDGIVLASVRKVGVKRLDDPEIVSTGDAAISRIRRSTRRAARKLAATDFDRLGDADKISHNTFISILGALHDSTKPSSVERVRIEVKTAGQRLPLAKTLAAFQG